MVILATCKDTVTGTELGVATNTLDNRLEAVRPKRRFPTYHAVVQTTRRG